MNVAPSDLLLLVVGVQVLNQERCGRRLHRHLTLTDGAEYRVIQSDR